MRALFLLPIFLASLTVVAAAVRGFEKTDVRQRKIDCKYDGKTSTVTFSGARGDPPYKLERFRHGVKLQNCYELSPKEPRSGRNFFLLEYKAEVEFASRPSESFFFEIVWVDEKGKTRSVLTEDVQKFPVEVQWGEHREDKQPMLRFISRDKGGKIVGEMYFKFDPSAEDPVFKAVLEKIEPLG